MILCVVIKSLRLFEPCPLPRPLTRGVAGRIRHGSRHIKTQLAKMAEGVHYIVSSDVNVSMFNGASARAERAAEEGLGDS